MIVSCTSQKVRLRVRGDRSRPKWWYMNQRCRANQSIVQASSKCAIGDFLSETVTTHPPIIRNALRLQRRKKKRRTYEMIPTGVNALRSPSRRSNFELPKYTLVPFPTEHSTQQLLRAESTWRTKVTCCDFKFHHAECNFQTADDCLLSENLPFGVKVTGNQFRSWSESSQRYGFSLTGQKKISPLRFVLLACMRTTTILSG